MDIKIAALRSLQTITFLVIVILAWLYHIMWKDFVFTSVILGVAIVYLVLQIRMPFNLDPDEKNRTIVRITLLLWIFILNLLLNDTPYEKIWFYFVFISIVLLILLDWRQILGSLSRFLKSVKLVVEYYLSK